MIQVQNAPTPPSRTNSKNPRKNLLLSKGKLQPLKERFSGANLNNRRDDVASTWPQINNDSPTQQQSMMSRTMNAGGENKLDTKSALKQQEVLYKEVDRVMRLMLEKVVVEKPAEVYPWVIRYLAGIKGGPEEQIKYMMAYRKQREVKALLAVREQQKERLRECLRKHYKKIEAAHESTKIRTSVSEELHTRNAELKKALALKVSKYQEALSADDQKVLALRHDNELLRVAIKQKMVLYCEHTGTPEAMVNASLKSVLDPNGVLPSDMGPLTLPGDNVSSVA